ncbi:MAG: hypothetical protein GF317_00495 [Candidatus Lokiarchaeota archaeon]|nr:hypothetical protein [Candidatus Lokiarchaeota archaeon]MBD3198455.1 hypothetical protein [Candidatus Lokiarchaeota archaeon]
MKEEKKNKKEDYHGVAPISDIAKKMKKHYDKDPKDWKIIGSKDKHGNTDTFINKKPNTYWLKSRSLSPFSALSMGTVVRNLEKDIDEETYGKNLSQKDLLRLFGMVVPVKKDKNVIASGIENYSNEKGEFLKKLIKERNSNLGYQLARKIDKKFRYEYPRRDEMYG